MLFFVILPIFNPIQSPLTSLYYSLGNGQSLAIWSFLILRTVLGATQHYHGLKNYLYTYYPNPHFHATIFSQLKTNNHLISVCLSCNYLTLKISQSPIQYLSFRLSTHIVSSLCERHRYPPGGKFRKLRTILTSFLSLTFIISSIRIYGDSNFKNMFWICTLSVFPQPFPLLKNLLLSLWITQKVKKCYPSISLTVFQNPNMIMAFLCLNLPCSIYLSGSATF